MAADLLRYAREIVWVRPNPFAVGITRLGEGHVTDSHWAMSAVVAMFVQTNTRGERHAVAREDSPMFDFQPMKLALASMEAPQSLIVLSSEDFDEFSVSYSGGLNNTRASIKALRAIERYAPNLRFLPKHLHHLVEEADQKPSSPYRHLARMFLRHDLADYESLVWLNGADGQISPKLLPKWQIDPARIKHIGGAWYAFESIDDAVTAKMFAPKTEIYRLREDQ